MNTCGTLLQALFPAPHPDAFAVFSTYLVTEHRCKDSGDDVLWRLTHRTQYWTKRRWLIPIHRPAIPEHWVLCVVDRISYHIDFFDSLAQKGDWLPDINVIIQLPSLWSILLTNI